LFRFVEEQCLAIGAKNQEERGAEAESETKTCESGSEMSRAPG
jgi:hypothetical protein